VEPAVREVVNEPRCRALLQAHDLVSAP
jgi:hypothetical protein